MKLNNAELSAEQILEQDAAGIYLGNLNTVDSDLKLPSVGKNGSSISWHSGEILFISHDGKITRPTYGVGDRVVTLTAKLVFSGISIEKNFEVTVIEQEDLVEIKKILPVQITASYKEKVKLPAFVIVEKNSDEYSVEHVIWRGLDQTNLEVPGFYEIHGSIENSKLEASALIHITENSNEDKVSDCNKRVFEFPAENVRLLEGSTFKQAQDQFLQYLLNVNDDQMLYNFRVTANRDEKKAPQMTGWDAPECNLKGHTTGHYLSALSKAYAHTKNNTIRKKLCYMIDELELCQKSLSTMEGFHSGFLSAYSEEQFDRLEKYEKYPTIWAPYYTLHKIMAGLLDAYHLSNITKALKICTDLGFWVYHRLSRLSQEQLDKMWSIYIAGEFGGMSEVLAQLYLDTGIDEFLVTANYFNNDKLYYPMSLGVDTLDNMHANQHIPQIIGALKMFEAEGSHKNFDIAYHFWKLVTQQHSYHLGGVGENEMFNKSGAIAAYITSKTAESCASYNMLKLTRNLFTYVPQASFMDFYENVLINHILSACDYQSPSGGTTYFMPLSPAAQKKFDTEENTCCHGTGLESPFGFTDAIYYYDQSALYVNLYLPSEVIWKEKEVVISQKSTGPYFTETAFNISGKAEFCLKLRKPCWLNEDPVISLNGERLSNLEYVDGYYEINRFWSDDVLVIKQPHSFHLARTQDDPTLAGIFYGPILLAAISDNTEYLQLPIKESTVNCKMKVEDGENGFELEGIKFLPLNQIYKEKFSTYFKVLQ